MPDDITAAASITTETASNAPYSAAEALRDLDVDNGELGGAAEANAGAEDLETQEPEDGAENADAATGKEEVDPDADPEKDPEEGETDPDEDEPSTDDSDAPKLDPDLLKALKGSPELTKKLRDVEKGLQKLHRRDRESRTEIEKLKKPAEAFNGYQQDFADPSKAGPLLAMIGDTVAQYHRQPLGELLQAAAKAEGKTLEELLGIKLAPAATPKTDEYGNEIPEWEAAGFTSQGEWKLAKRLEAMEARDKERDDEAKAAKQREQQEAQKRAEQAQFDTFVDEQAGKAIKKMAALEPKFKVTKEMVKKALTEYPQHRQDVIRAIKAAFPDELAAARSALGQQYKGKRAPDMAPSHSSRGRTTPPPGKLRAAQAFALTDD